MDDLAMLERRYGSVAEYYRSQFEDEAHRMDREVKEVRQMSYTFEQVDKAFQKVVDYVKSIENVWNETRDLKLHDVSFNMDKIIK